MTATLALKRRRKLSLSEPKTLPSRGIVAARADDDADGGVGRQRRSDAEAVGDDRQVAQLGREPSGEMQRRRAGIHHQHLARLDDPGGQAADPLALLDMLLVALAQGRLGAEGPRRGAAIGAAQHALLAELVEIAPDGLGGDAEIAGQIGDADGRRGPQLAQDPRLALGLLQLLPRLPCPRRTFSARRQQRLGKLGKTAGAARGLRPISVCGGGLGEIKDVRHADGVGEKAEHRARHWANRRRRRSLPGRRPCRWRRPRPAGAGSWKACRSRRTSR